MKFHSTHDILKFAIAKEESSVRFYRTLSAHTQKAETSAMFEVLARQEEQHIEALKLEMLKQGFTLTGSVTADEDDDERGIHVELDSRAEQMDRLQALRLGVQKERAAFKLYAELMVMTEDLDARKMFLELAEEEMRHVLKLEREVQVLTQSNKE